MDTVRILIVDDDERFAQALEALFDADGRFELVGWASNGAEAVGLVTTAKPDVLTMDIEMPVLDGVEATRAIISAVPGTRIVLLTGSRSGDRVDEALAAGALAHVTKGKAFEELVPALLSAMGSPLPQA